MLKRALDVTVSVIALFVSSPLFVIIGTLVFFESGFPILFKQERVGLGFRRFWILKFRTMQSGSSGAMVTVKGDSRVTFVGRLLRASKLDELPQFWNVLRGEMSLVGPRPEVVRYVTLFADRYQTVLSMRPGITDLASIRFRNEEQVLASEPDPQRFYIECVLPAKLELAEEYVRNQSFQLDLRILLATIRVTLLPTRVQL